MEKDKITAMWEEDGDLMRIKNFFGYVYQDEGLKQRIKQKTLAKISAPDEISEDEPSLKIEGEQNPVVESPKKKQPNKRNPLSLLKSINRKKTKSILKTFSAAAVVVFAVYLGSILSDGTVPFTVGMGSPKAATEQAQNDASYDTEGPADGFMSSVSNERSAIMDEKGFSPEDAPAPTVPTIPESGEITEAQEKDITERKIIYTLEATLRVENVDQTVDLIEDKITSLGGYISESRKNTDGENEINAYMSVRIPVKHFENFKGNLSQYGTVSNQYLFTDDVSRQYFDVETRLRSWEAQEKRYLEILEQAATVEDILKIEDSLANVRREMESLKGQLKFWDNRVDYSEIRMNIYPQKSNLAVSDPWQPVSIESTFLAAKNAVIKSISFIWNGVNYLIVFVGYAIPVLVLLVGWLGYRRLRKSRSQG